MCVCRQCTSRCAICTIVDVCVSAVHITVCLLCYCRCVCRQCTSRCAFCTIVDVCVSAVHITVCILYCCRLCRQCTSQYSCGLQALLLAQPNEITYSLPALYGNATLKDSGSLLPARLYRKMADVDREIRSDCL
jgi:hypothetical protein